MNKVFPIWNSDTKCYENNNTAFCTRPWTSVMIPVDGQCKPCCRSLDDSQHKYSTIENHWNSESLIKMQQQMLSGIKPWQCEPCHTREGSGAISSRLISLNCNIDDQLSTPNNRSKIMELRLLEIKMSNLCNFKCRICHWGASSAIAAEHNRVDNTNYPKVITPAFMLNTPLDLVGDIVKYLPSLEDIVIAGGEPLLQPEAMQLMDAFIEHGRTDVKISINTNGSVEPISGDGIFDRLRRFPNLDYAVSIDAAGSAAEYWRFGTKWDTLVANLFKFKQHLPNIKLHVTITVSWVNAFAILDLIQELKNTPVDTIRFNAVSNPEYLSVWAAPEETKKEILKAYTEFDFSIIPLSGSVTIESIIKLLDLPSMSINELKNQFQNMIKLDKIRGEDFFSAFPEHEPLRALLT